MVYQAKMEEVRRAVAALPEKQRAAVLMHKYQEMEYTQIAKVLNCSESAVYHMAISVLFLTAYGFFTLEHTGLTIKHMALTVKHMGLVWQ